MPPTTQRKQIILFGSSIHPIHVGHLAILSNLTKAFPEAEVWLLPVYTHPDYETCPHKPSADSFEDRCELAEIMISEHKLETQVKISKVERDAYLHKLKQTKDQSTIRVTTLDLLNHLRDTFLKNKEDVDISLALGEDVYSDLIAGKWGEEGVAVIGHCKSIIRNLRPGYQTGVTCAFINRMFDYKKKIASQPFVKQMTIAVEGASSTLIREWIKDGMPADNRAVYITPAVAERIKEKGMYDYPTDIKYDTKKNK